MFNILYLLPANVTKTQSIDFIHRDFPIFIPDYLGFKIINKLLSMFLNYLKFGQISSNFLVYIALSHFNLIFFI